MENFLKAEVYKLILDKSIVMRSFKYFSDTGLETKEITFDPDCEIKIITSYSGGGFGFSALVIFNIEIKKGEKTERFKEQFLYNEGTKPIQDFVVKNKDVLFKLVSKID